MRKTGLDRKWVSASGSAKADTNESYVLRKVQIGLKLPVGSGQFQDPAEPYRRSTHQDVFVVNNDTGAHCERQQAAQRSTTRSMTSKKSEVKRTRDPNGNNEGRIDLLWLGLRRRRVYLRRWVGHIRLVFLQQCLVCFSLRLLLVCHQMSKPRRFQKAAGTGSSAQGPFSTSILVSAMVVRLPSDVPAKAPRSSWLSGGLDAQAESLYESSL